MKRNEFLKRLLGAGAAAAISTNSITTVGQYEKKIGGKKQTHFSDKNSFNGKELSGICTFKCSG